MSTVEFCDVPGSSVENVNLETSNIAPNCVSSSTKKHSVLLLAKRITFTCCFSCYFKARWPNYRSCHIMIVKQLRTECPNSPSSVLSFLFCIYIVCRLYCLLLLVSSAPLLLSCCLAPCFLMLLLEQVPSCAAESTKLSLCFSPAPMQLMKQQKSNKDSQESKRAQLLALVHMEKFLGLYSLHLQLQ